MDMSLPDHGFVPYLGLGISRERLDFTHFENGKIVELLAYYIETAEMIEAAAFKAANPEYNLIYSHCYELESSVF